MHWPCQRWCAAANARRLRRLGDPRDATRLEVGSRVELGFLGNGTRARASRAPRMRDYERRNAGAAWDRSGTRKAGTSGNLLHGGVVALRDIGELGRDRAGGLVVEDSEQVLTAGTTDADAGLLMRERLNVDDRNGVVPPPNPESSWNHERTLKNPGASEGKERPVGEKFFVVKSP